MCEIAVQTLLELWQLVAMTTALWMLFQSPATSSVENLFLTHDMKLPWHSFMLFPPYAQSQ